MRGQKAVMARAIHARGEVFGERLRRQRPAHQLQPEAKPSPTL